MKEQEQVYKCSHCQHVLCVAERPFIEYGRFKCPRCKKTTRFEAPRERLESVAA